jgi:hypothetical protein
VLAAVDGAGKEITLLVHCAPGDSGRYSPTGWLCQFKLDWPSCLLLDEEGTFSYVASGDHVTDPQGNPITVAPLAVDGQIEQGHIAPFPFDLEPNTDGPHFSELEGWLLADESPQWLGAVSWGGSGGR